MKRYDQHVATHDGQGCLSGNPPAVIRAGDCAFAERLSLFWIFALLNYLYADVVALFAIVGARSHRPFESWKSHRLGAQKD
jgi:hypothetical protein